MAHHKQQLVRFVIEQYRDELILQLRGGTDIREHEAAVAEGREAVASDLLNVLHSIPIQSIATNGPSLVSCWPSSSQCGDGLGIFVPSSHTRSVVNFNLPTPPHINFRLFAAASVAPTHGLISSFFTSI